MVTTVLLALEYDGLCGLGEGFPIRYRGETADAVAATSETLASKIAQLWPPPSDRADAVMWIERAASHIERTARDAQAAACAINIALHDLVGQRLGMTLEELLAIDHIPQPTDFSLGIDEPSLVMERAARARAFPALKVKVGGPADMQTVQRIREVYAGPLRIDANTGWDRTRAAAIVPLLEVLGVELIEQPFSADDIDSLAWLQDWSPIPIVADESAVVIADLDRLAGKVAGVNIKLAKCGGITAARAMIARARKLGMKVMLGCMEETSVGIRAAVVLAGMVDWVDLDGCLLLSQDPVAGLSLADDCRWLPPSGPGLGLVLRPDSGLGESLCHTDRTDDRIRDDDRLSD